MLSCTTITHFVFRWLWEARYMSEVLFWDLYDRGHLKVCICSRLLDLGTILIYVQASPGLKLGCLLGHTRALFWDSIYTSSFLGHHRRQSVSKSPTMDEVGDFPDFVGPASDRIRPITLYTVRNIKLATEHIARGLLRLGVLFLIRALVAFSKAVLLSLPLVLAIYIVLPIHLFILLPKAYMYLWQRRQHRDNAYRSQKDC
jgi:hypothetical protein